MKKHYHLLIGTVLFVVLLITLEKVTISSIMIPILLSLGCDIDKAFGKEYHRNWLFHSIFIPLFIVIFNFDIEHFLVMLAFGVHCLCDINLTPSSWRGDYCIKLWRGTFGKDEVPEEKTISPAGKFSTIWLLMNGIGSIVLFTIFYLLLLV